MDIVSVEAAVSLAGAAFSVYQYFVSRRKDDVEAAVQAAVEEKFDPLASRMAIMETKMEVFWRDVSFDAARILHHPEASRERVDDLLDIFMARTMTTEEEAELRGYLTTIRDWEPGMPAPFRMFPGEQLASAILLSTMDHVTAKDKKDQEND